MIWTFGSEAKAEAQFLTKHSKAGDVYSVVFTERSIPKGDMRPRIKAMVLAIRRQGWYVSGIDWSEDSDNIVQIWAGLR
jgi:hypothetical protein